MAFLFANVVSRNAAENGGIAVATARVFEQRIGILPAVAQWSYWLGWAPSPAIYGAMIGGYVHNVLFPTLSPFFAIAAAFGVVIIIFALNVFPVIISARVQCTVAALTIVALLFLVLSAFRNQDINISYLLSPTPPGGWNSRAGISSVADGFFLAGWSTYGAEIALTYITDYRDGYIAARRTLVAATWITGGVYSLFPLLFIATLDIKIAASDPNIALVGWLGATDPGIARASVLIALVLSMLLAVNMTTLASSRLLGQMSRNGYCRLNLSQQNRFGRPSRALLFDFVANAVLLVIFALLTPGDLSSLPTALLATANVGYFVSLILGLIAGSLSDRKNGGGRPRVALGIILSATNTVMLAFGGMAWGWTNIFFGSFIIILMTYLLSPSGQRASRFAPPGES